MATTQEVDAIATLARERDAALALVGKLRAELAEVKRVSGLSLQITRLQGEYDSQFRLIEGLRNEVAVLRAGVETDKASVTREMASLNDALNRAREVFAKMKAAG